MRHKIRNYPPGPRVHFTHKSSHHMFCSTLIFPRVTLKAFNLQHYTASFNSEDMELILDLRSGARSFYHDSTKHCAFAYIGMLVRREPLLRRYLRHPIVLPIFEEEPGVLVIPFAGLGKKKLEVKGDLRISFRYKALHDHVAALEGKNLSDYVRDALDHYVQDQHPGLWTQFEEAE